MRGILICGAIMFAIPTCASAEYRLSWLDDGVGNYYGQAVAINDAGDVVGLSIDRATNAASSVLWHGGVPTVVAAGEWSGGGPTAIGEDGTVVGSVSFGDPYGGAGAGTRGFVWREGRLCLYSGSAAADGFGPIGVNAAGTLVGQAAGFVAAVRIDGVTRVIPGVGGLSSWATAVNDAGAIVGDVEAAGGEVRAFVYRAGVVTRVASLGGTHDDAVAVNASGVVAGTSGTGDGRSRAFAWVDGTTVELPVWDASFGTAAKGINDHGDVVGIAGDAAGGFAAYWSDGRLVDLNTRVGHEAGDRLTAAYDINNAGEIVGVGLHGGRTRGFLLTPLIGVPEPTSLLGLAALAAIRLSSRVRRAR